jgi:hypothetical protein
VNGYGGGGGTAVVNVNGDLTGFTTYYGQITNLPPKNHGETAAQRRDNTHTRLGALAKTTQDEGYHHLPYPVMQIPKAMIT